MFHGETHYWPPYIKEEDGCTIIDLETYRTYMAMERVYAYLHSGLRGFGLDDDNDDYDDDDL